MSPLPGLRFAALGGGSLGPAGFCWARGPVHQCTSVASLVPRVNPKDPQLRICNASHRVISCVRRAIESRREPALQGVGHALGRPGTSTLIPTAHTTASPSVPPSCCPPRPGGNAAPLLSTLRMHLTPPPPLASTSQADHGPTGHQRRSLVRASLLCCSH